MALKNRQIILRICHFLNNQKGGGLINNSKFIEEIKNIVLPEELRGWKGWIYLEM